MKPPFDKEASVIFEPRDQKFLDSLIEHLPAMVFVKEAQELRFEHFNRAGEELLGLSREQLLGRNDYDFFPKEQADFFVEKDREVLRSGKLKDIPEEPIQTPRGTRWLHTRKIPILDHRGIVRYLLGVSIDITERKRAEERLQLQFELVRGISDAVIHLDAQRLVTGWNKGAEQIYGWKTAEAVGRLFSELVKTEYPFISQEEALNLLVKDGSWSGEVMQVGKDGVQLHILCSASTVTDASGTAVGYAALNRDITAQKRIEEERRNFADALQAQTAKLLEANEELEGFTYSVSHDLRTPLRAIDGFSQILLEEHNAALDQDTMRLLEVIRKNTRKMDQLIDSLLVFSRLGRQALRQSHVEMSVLVHTALEEIISLAPERTVLFEMGPLPDTVCDATLIQQVWVNLLSNAFKYTRPKADAKVSVEGSVEEDQLVYRVRDNGVGFDPAYMSKLFGVFQRLHSDTEFEGTGVGLALIQRIVRRHGGKVWAEGKPSEGATFWFTLPRKEHDDESQTD